KNLLPYVYREEILHCVQNDRMIGLLHFDTTYPKNARLYMQTLIGSVFQELCNQELCKKH
ncbi:MAG TPA: hypothetical protein DD464_00970, partial [Bacteroides sp.]|nr:hypothetical protein [Bacteroides sp.]